ncbi:hypothetical protein J4477_01705 [Candidatus Pacearchaeota archaeon]|nr:hypothetical protein [Candidatus Pacearchaeota archaeon]
MVIAQIASVVDFEQGFESLVKTLQILGGIAGIYLILWIIGTIFNIRRTKLLKEVISKLEQNNKKLDRLLKSNNLKKH